MKTMLSLAAWNVTTLLNLKDAERTQKQTVRVARELDRYDIDIATLQENHLEGQVSLQKKHYTFFSG